MTKLVILLSFALTLSSCSSSPIYFQPVCRHRAVYVASVLIEAYPTRIVVGYYGGKRHAETQGYVNGGWAYFRPSNIGIVKVGKIIGFRPYRFYDVVKFLNLMRNPLAIKHILAKEKPKPYKKEVKEMVEVSKHKLEALASGIESCVALLQDGIDPNLSGQHPDEMLLDIAKLVKTWIENSCENASQSKE